MSKAQVIHKLGPPLPRGGKPTPRRPTPGRNPSVLNCFLPRSASDVGLGAAMERRDISRRGAFSCHLASFLIHILKSATSLALATDSRPQPERARM